MGTRKTAISPTDDPAGAHLILMLVYPYADGIIAPLADEITKQYG